MGWSVDVAFRLAQLTKQELRVMAGAAELAGVGRMAQPGLPRCRKSGFPTSPYRGCLSSMAGKHAPGLIRSIRSPGTSPEAPPFSSPVRDTVSYRPVNSCVWLAGDPIEAMKGRRARRSRSKAPQAVKGPVPGFQITCGLARQICYASCLSVRPRRSWGSARVACPGELDSFPLADR
jgi:hypothetical protein